MNTKELACFDLKMESWDMGDNNPVFMVSVYTKGGAYVGAFDKSVQFLIAEKGIVPERATEKSSVCSIGKSVKDGKWYGWSHRAIHGFSIGDVVKEGDCCATSGVTDDYLKKHPEADKSLPAGFVAKSEDDCKKMAIAFADCVS